MTPALPIDPPEIDPLADPHPDDPRPSGPKDETKSDVSREKPDPSAHQVPLPGLSRTQP